jgi:hypothetical protein
MSEDITEKLDRLANFQAERDFLALHKQELIDQVLTPEIKARLEEIEMEFAQRVEAVDENIAALEEEIKNDVIQHGTTVRGTFLRAVWNKGRVTWNTKAMDGYASTHPEILEFRKEGQPFVSIKKT